MAFVRLRQNFSGMGKDTRLHKSAEAHAGAKCRSPKRCIRSESRTREICGWTLHWHRPPMHGTWIVPARMGRRLLLVTNCWWNRRTFVIFASTYSLSGDCWDVQMYKALGQGLVSGSEVRIISGEEDRHDVASMRRSDVSWAVFPNSSCIYRIRTTTSL